MKVYATVQLDEGETLDKSASLLADELLAAFEGDAATDTCQVTVTSTATRAPEAADPPA